MITAFAHVLAISLRSNFPNTGQYFRSVPGLGLSLAVLCRHTIKARGQRSEHSSGGQFRSSLDRQKAGSVIGMDRFLVPSDIVGKAFLGRWPDGIELSRVKMSAILQRD